MFNRRMPPLAHKTESKFLAANIRNRKPYRIPIPRLRKMGTSRRIPEITKIARVFIGRRQFAARRETVPLPPRS